MLKLLYMIIIFFFFFDKMLQKKMYIDLILKINNKTILISTEEEAKIIRELFHNSSLFLSKTLAKSIIHFLSNVQNNNIFLSCLILTIMHQYELVINIINK